jgi:putative CocE/NonD family hydrolase
VHLRPALVAAAAAVTVLPVAGYAAQRGGGSPGWAPRPATYGTVTQHDVLVPMSDGVQLHADVTRPAINGVAAPGQFPVVLDQTPYNKGVSAMSPYLAQRGYIQVTVDVRGTGSSPGTWDAFGAREQQDYLETARWVHTLPGGTGSYALAGTSYDAIDQFLTAEQQPPGLAAMFPVVPSADPYRDVVVHGGMLDTGFMPLWFGLVAGTGMVPGGATTPAQGLSTLLQHVGGAVTFQGAKLAQAALGGDPVYDSGFYRLRAPIEHVDRVTVPTFVVGGEYDLFQRGEPLLYNALAARGVPAKLLIGPWTHLQADGGTFELGGAKNLDELRLRWFDHYLRGVADPTLDTDVPPVTVNRLGKGGNSFESSTSYPTPQTRYAPLPLGGSPSVGRSGTLGGTAAPGRATIAWNPLSGLCSESTEQWTAGLAVSPCSTHEQLNDLTGATWDLPVSGSTPLRFDGPSAAHLYVSTTRRDADLTVRLEDVGPDGRVTPLTAGWQSLAMRALDPSRSVVRDGLVVQPYHPDTVAGTLPVTPGTIYELQVELFPTAAQVQPGHALRLAIQQLDAPTLVPPAPALLASIGSTVTVYSDAAHPSSLTLGVER